MRRALFVVLAAIAALGITALASAGGKPPTNPNNPVITFVSPSPAVDAVLEDGDVTFAFTFNRTPKQVAAVTCALSGQASLSSACDTPVPFPPDSKNTSKSGEAYTDLANGEYTLTVTLTLTGGGVYTATRNFTVDVPPVCSVENMTTNTKYTDLQTAIDDASTGDELDITGTCTGNYTVDNNLTLKGIDHSGMQSTLDGNAAGSVLIIGSGTTVTIDSLTITHGDAGITAGGGGINVEGFPSGSTVTVNNSTITANSASQGGGGIRVNVATLTLNNSTVSGNTSGGGGGIMNFGTVVMQGSSTVSGNTTGGSGGGVLNALGVMTMNDSSTITGNSAARGGGVRNDSGSTFTMNGSSSISTNTASSDGGGIFNSFGGTLNGAVDGGNVHDNTPNNLVTGP